MTLAFLFTVCRWHYVDIFYKAFLEYKISGRTLHTLVVGWLSDIWLAFLWTFLSCIFIWPFRKKSYLRNIWVSTSFVMIVFFSIHIAYFDYFKQPIHGPHLLFLLDADFVKSNYASIWNIRAISTFLLSCFAGIFFYFFLPKVKQGRPSLKVALGSFTLIFLVTLGAHVLNIRYRIQWDIPEPLSVHPTEYLYLSLKTAPAFEALLAKEEPHDASSYPGLKFVSSPTSFAKEELWLRKKIADLNQHGEKVRITVVIMESARVSDLGASADRPSLTPTLDKLAQSGITFKKAFSTGRVTRSAQEAIWCGYLSHEGNSLMRSRLHLDFPCIPQMVRRTFGNEDVSFHWLHGGQFSYDQQGSFWLRQGVDTLLSSNDFEETAPRTPWGYSDWEIFKKAFAHLQTPQSRHNVHMNMILTMTHHSPWHLPEDQQELLKQMGSYELLQSPHANAHPSYQTLLYSDAALGWFIDQLHTHDMWKNHLLLIMGDHGMTTPSLHADYQPPKNALEWGLSHVPLIMTGGLIDEMLQQLTIPHEHSHFVSLTQGATFLMRLFATSEFETLSPSLFEKMDDAIVFSDLGDRIFFPQIDHVRRKSDFDKYDLNKEERYILTLYRHLNMLDHTMLRR